MPLSYGTLSHLCASIAHESAAAYPCTRCARCGAAAAQSPNAPSTCTQAPAALAGGMISSAGSKAPVLTLPACRQTSVLSSSGGSAAARMRPWPSTGTRITRSRPRPTSVSALRTLTCTSSLTTTVIGGAPNKPLVSTFQPRRASRACRAAASPEKFACVEQPAHRHLFQPRGDGREGDNPRVLIPRRREAARRHGRRERPADHEPEEAPTRRGHGGGRSDLVEQGDHLRRVGRTLGERLVEPRQVGEGLGRRSDAPVLQTGQVSGRAIGGRSQQVFHAGNVSVL